jgi:large subunit ribosomal protein L30
MENKTVTVTLKKSSIGATERQKRTIVALGLRHLHHEVKLPANDAVMGMVKKVQRWLVIK